MIPSYGLVNIFAGYSHKIKDVNLFFNGSISNLLNTNYIADATNSFYAPYNFDAQSASVMFGQGFRFNVSLGIQF
jgi:elongation factor P hydroxylase